MLGALRVLHDFPPADGAYAPEPALCSDLPVFCCDELSKPAAVGGRAPVLTSVVMRLTIRRAGTGQPQASEVPIAIVSRIDRIARPVKARFARYRAARFPRRASRASASRRLRSCRRLIRAGIERGGRRDVRLASVRLRHGDGRRVAPARRSSRPGRGGARASKEVCPGDDRG